MSSNSSSSSVVVKEEKTSAPSSTTQSTPAAAASSSSSSGTKNAASKKKQPPKRNKLGLLVKKPKKKKVTKPVPAPQASAAPPPNAQQQRKHSKDKKRRRGRNVPTVSIDKLNVDADLMPSTLHDHEAEEQAFQRKQQQAAQRQIKVERPSVAERVAELAPTKTSKHDDYSSSSEGSDSDDSLFGKRRRSGGRGKGGKGGKGRSGKTLKKGTNASGYFSDYDDDYADEERRDEKERVNQEELNKTYKWRDVSKKWRSHVRIKAPTQYPFVPRNFSRVNENGVKEQLEPSSSVDFPAVKAKKDLPKRHALLVQAPDTLSLKIDSEPKTEVKKEPGVSTTSGSSTSKKSDADDLGKGPFLGEINYPNAVKDVHTGKIGELKVHKSGKAYLYIDGVRYKVTPGFNASARSEFADLTNGEQLSHVLQCIGRLIVAPDIEHMLQQKAATHTSADEVTVVNHE